MKFYTMMVLVGLVVVACTTPDFGDDQGAQGPQGLAGQDGDDGDDGADGQDGQDGAGCSVVGNDDGTLTITCGDESQTVEASGCTLESDGDSATITCGDDTFVINNGEDGEDGQDGADGQDGEGCIVEGNGDVVTVTCGDTSVDIPVAGSDGDADADADVDVCDDGDLKCGVDDGEPAVLVCDDDEWVVYTNCGDDESCVIQNGEPTCAADPCPDECDDDDRRCSGDDLEVCEDGQWVTYECDDDEICSEAEGETTCVFYGDPITETVCHLDEVEDNFGCPNGYMCGEISRRCVAVPPQGTGWCYDPETYWDGEYSCVGYNEDGKVTYYAPNMFPFDAYQDVTCGGSAVFQPSVIACCEATNPEEMEDALPEERWSTLQCEPHRGNGFLYVD